ncbi:MAG TPA: DUF1588 domain-containing protein [Polyangiaceae bacterium]
MGSRFWGKCAAPLLFASVLGCGYSNDTQPPAPGSSGSTSMGGGAGSGGAVSCEATQPGVAPLHLLTRFQYDNAVRDLFGDTSRPARAFPPENEADGYRTNAAANPANPLLVENYLIAAETVAARAAAGVAELAPCAEGGDQAACGYAFIGSFASRAFRRPASEEELMPLMKLFDAGLSKGYATGIELVIQAVLQSPQFLYRVEALKSATPETGAIALGSYELANRLAFTLWGSVPDAELMAAAASGTLVTAKDVEREARRLVESSKARDIVRDFSEQWLMLSRLEGAARDGTTLEPTVLAGSLKGSLAAFLDDAYFGASSSFDNVFTSPKVWFDQAMAPLYGAGEPQSGFEARTMDDPRSGLLSQPALLTLLSHSSQTAPVLRGVFVRERILCLEVPPPPPDVNVNPPDPDPNATTRERFRQHTEQAACSACHKLIDGIGFGFERYDQLGRYRATENGLDVDESGSVIGSEEAGLDGDFVGVAELSSRIAVSPRARDCLATHWYRYSFGRRETAEDQCSLDQLKQRFAASAGNLKELLVGLTLTDSFLYRPAITEAP